MTYPRAKGTTKGFSGSLLKKQGALVYQEESPVLHWITEMAHIPHLIANNSFRICEPCDWVVYGTLKQGTLISYKAEARPPETLIIGIH